MSENLLVRVIHKVRAFIDGRTYAPGEEALIPVAQYHPDVHTLAEGETLPPQPKAEASPHPIADSVQALADENAALKTRVAELEAELATRPPAPVPAPAPVAAPSPAPSGDSAAGASA